MIWEQLPAPVRAAVEEHTGRVVKAESAAAGATSAMTATLHTSTGELVFCKAIHGDHPRAWLHRTEARAAAAGVGPRLRWTVENTGWLVLGLEHFDGRHADLNFGSGDLAVLAAALTENAARLTPSPLEPVQPLAVRWAYPLGWGKLLDHPPTWLNGWTRSHLALLAQQEQRAPALIDGHTLIHTDPVPQNWLIKDGNAHLVDWAWPARAAAWVDTALCLIRLIDAGHTPEQAEQWAHTVPVYAAAPPDAITAMAAATAGLWTRHAATSAHVRQHELARVAQRWAQVRLEQQQNADTPGTSRSS
ncbi:hypothetical protein [Actinocatenispora comari]|uniref:hypothetical protein n=1 Tax=Actinocatenispora comari TaxID=2807577 RepID=UPI001A90E9D2|nr:hypothetical protein [Actinocatenispora comari]